MAQLAVGRELPADRGLFFAAFTFPEPVDGKPTSRAEKDLIWRLMKLGIPYVYLSQSGSDAAEGKKRGTSGLRPQAKKAGPVDCDAVKAQLTKLLGQKLTLGEFPATFLAERIRGRLNSNKGT
jgi:hypothetical protein